MSYILRVMDSRKTAAVKQTVWMVAVLLALLLCLSGCSVPEKPPMPTKSAGQQLFHEHYPEINEVVELLWAHCTEFDSMVSEGEDTLHLFSRGWTKEDWRYARTTLTEDEKDRIFSVWNLLDTNALVKFSGNYVGPETHHGSKGYYLPHYHVRHGGSHVFFLGGITY